MSKKFLVSLGYSANFVFNDRESAMRFYMAVTEGMPVKHIYMTDRDEKFENVEYVRDDTMDISLSMKDESAFCNMTEAEFKERAKKQPIDIDGDVREVPAPPAQIAHVEIDENEPMPF